MGLDLNLIVRHQIKHPPGCLLLYKHILSTILSIEQMPSYLIFTMMLHDQYQPILQARKLSQAQRYEVIYLHCTVSNLFSPQHKFNLGVDTIHFQGASDLIEGGDYN